MGGGRSRRSQCCCCQCQCNPCCCNQRRPSRKSRCCCLTQKNIHIWHLPQPQVQQCQPQIPYGCNSFDGGFSGALDIYSGNYGSFDAGLQFGGSSGANLGVYDGVALDNYSGYYGGFEGNDLNSNIYSGYNSGYCGAY